MTALYLISNSAGQCDGLYVSLYDSVTACKLFCMTVCQWDSSLDK